MNDDIERLVSSICNSDKPSDALVMFSIARSVLGEYKIMLASRDSVGVCLGSTSNREFSGGAVVRSIFPTERVLVLDTDTLQEMQNGAASFGVDHSISLDTMAVSYLWPFLFGGSRDRLPKDMQEVFDFIARDDVDVNPFPYVLENLSNLDDARNEQKIRNILKAYEILRTLDVDCLRETRVVRSVLSSSELEESSRSSFDRMLERRADSAFYEAVQYRHRFVYIYLLKMVEIHLAKPAAEIDEKMSVFLDFCHSEMSCMAAREIALARHYFHKGQNLTFFGKIQKNRTDIFDSLKGMAWDLYHVRQLEEAVTFDVKPEARYYLPAILTFDKRFIEVMDIYPLKAIAFKKSSSQLIAPFYAGDWFENLSATKEVAQTFFHKFYSKEARFERRDGLHRAKSNMAEVMGGLEASIRRLALA